MYSLFHILMIKIDYDQSEKLKRARSAFDHKNMKLTVLQFKSKKI